MATKKSATVSVIIGTPHTLHGVVVPLTTIKDALKNSKLAMGKAEYGPNQLGTGPVLHLTWAALVAFQSGSSLIGDSAAKYVGENSEKILKSFPELNGATLMWSQSQAGFEHYKVPMKKLIELATARWTVLNGMGSKVQGPKSNVRTAKQPAQPPAWAAPAKPKKPRTVKPKNQPAADAPALEVNNA